MNEYIHILGNKLNCFASFHELYTTVLQDISSGATRGYITVNNVHTMMEAYKNPAYRKIINSAYLSIPDGKPLEIVGRLKGNSNICRLFGPSVMENFIAWGRESAKRHFFIGSSETTLKKLVEAINAKYPGTIISGTISPPFEPMENWQNEQFLEQINATQADFIWVGLGAPKQEIWMSENSVFLKKGVMIGIGAGFDYMAGNTSHAPTWMKNASLEWLFRLIQEPKRLWKRYLTTIPPFMALASLDILRHRLR